MDCEKKAGLFCLDFIKANMGGRKEMTFLVATESMLPIIRPRDRVVVKSCGVSDVKPGDIVLFERCSSLIIHRLLGKRISQGELVLIPKADRAYREEAPLPPGQLLGRVVKVQKKLMVYHLDRWHGRAINRFFYMYSLLKMKAYAWVTRIARCIKREVNREDILIRLCSTTTVGRETETAVRRILNQDVDWEYFLEKIQGEDTASLVYKVLRTMNHANALVPRHAMDYLKDFYYATLAVNIALFKPVINVMNAFRENHIESIVFKGLFLAGSVYGDIGMRPMGDVDLLLRKEDMAKADILLRRTGFNPEFELTDFANISPGQYRNSLMYRSSHTIPVAVHIHWHVVNVTPFHEKVMQKIDMDKIWNESVTIHREGVEMRTFSLHHQIIYLCMHAVHHAFYPLIRLCDIHELLGSEKSALNWDRLIGEARSFHLSKSVFYVLYLISRMFGTPIPESVLQRLRPRRLGIIERTFLSSVLTGKPILTGEWLICFSMNDTFRDRFKFIWKLLFPPQKELAVIRKRNDSRACVADYLKRLSSGITCAFRVMYSFVLQVSFKL